jgi:hypothetical protein
MEDILKRALIACLFFMLSASAFSRVNVRTYPFSFFNLQIDIPVSRNWTVGPHIVSTSDNDDDFEVKTLGAGVRANYWFNEDVYTQGWYLGPSLSYVNVSVEDSHPSFGKLKGEASALSMSVVAGYHWVWESFNIMLGAGPAYYSIGDITVDDSAGNAREYTGYNGSGLALELTLGWLF